KGLGTAKRPEEIHTWIKCARATMPKIKNIDRFVQEWGEWWNALNAERHKDGGKLIKSEDASLEVLWKPSVNGMLGVLIGLKWWRKETGETSEWLEALEDVTWVMRRLLNKYVFPVACGNGRIELNVD
ncbi:hypothetical protein K438DRAFT_1607907, partial [Mycena galopus ATCC 62051]